MRPAAIASACIALVPAGLAAAAQRPLILEHQPEQVIGVQPDIEPKPLHGRFLHITDIHPDPFYRLYSSTEQKIACHRSEGPAGYWGAETSDCDSPINLVNATFKWIEENLKDKIDFIIWTGDSARHDNDEKHPRTATSVTEQNQFLVDKFKEVFGLKDHSRNQLSIPIVPSFGNNDILPHNLFFKGPNKWTKAYSDIWRPFIPEEQRHGFDRGGWFYVEVIPNKLAVFSLNTLYFFDSNTAVDGCASHSEPGFEHFEWLRIQLEFLRQRGVKAIMSGHVPPARNDEKVGWDETCYQKYALWMRQYRDVVVGSVYGHMNVEHFLLLDFEDIEYSVMSESNRPPKRVQAIDDDVSIQLNAPDYINALRDLWSDIPKAPKSLASSGSYFSHALRTRKKSKSKKSEEEKFYDKIGGEYAERYALSFVSASVVPNFFSSLRVYEYNTTGLDGTKSVPDDTASLLLPPWPESGDKSRDADSDPIDQEMNSPWRRGHNQENPRETWSLNEIDTEKKKKPKKPNFVVPDPPSTSAPPGPAYSPQTLSLLGYTQYFANNTHLNNDMTDQRDDPDDDGMIAQGWNSGRYVDRRPGKTKSSPDPLNFTYDVEYNTRDEKDAWRLGEGLSVVKWVELASRMAEFESEEEADVKGHKNRMERLEEGEGQKDETVEGENTLYPWRLSNLFKKDHQDDTDSADESTILKKKKGEKKKKKKKKKKKHRKIVDRNWFAFCSRAVVGTMDDDELHDKFGN